MVQWVGHGSLKQSLHDRFPVDHKGVKNGIHPQMLLCHNNKPLLINILFVLRDYVLCSPSPLPSNTTMFLIMLKNFRLFIPNLYPAKVVLLACVRSSFGDPSIGNPAFPVRKPSSLQNMSTYLGGRRPPGRFFCSLTT